MTKQPLRWSGLLCIVGSVVFTFAFLLHPALTSVQLRSTLYTFMHVLSAAAVVLLLFGLLGMYTRQTSWMKRLGLPGIIIICLGSSFEIGYLLFDGFFTPRLALPTPVALHETALHALLLQHIGTIAVSFLPLELCFVVGYLMLAQVLLDGHGVPHWSGLWLLGGALLFGPLTFLPSFVENIGAALLGLGFFEMGYFILFGSKEGNKSPIR